MSDPVGSPLEEVSMICQQVPVLSIFGSSTSGLFPLTAPGDPKESGPGGRQHFGPVGVVGKKKAQRTATSAQKGGAATEDKDADGSFRIPNWRGVWVNPQGKHFVKVKGKKLTSPGTDETLYFDSFDEAAKGHDSVVKEDGSDPTAELNFQEDGTRIVYEDIATSTTTGLGGSASNVVPALSVINIKVSAVKPFMLCIFTYSTILSEMCW
jgi:hypothetical protein